jgi:hypothetical protein
MPIAEIINEIDAYLSRLRQAREILSGGRMEAPEKRVLRSKTNIMVRQVKPLFSVGRRSDKNNSQSNPPVAHLKNVGTRVRTSAPDSMAVTPNPSQSVLPVIAQPERAIEQNFAITRLPARRRRGSTRSASHRSAKPTSANKPDALKPAIAVAGPVNTKIVVVPAKQVQQEREQAERPPVQRPRLSTSGLSGRLAFEALFKGGTEPSKVSGQ